MSARNNRGRFVRREEVIPNNVRQEEDEEEIEIESPITKNNILILIFCIFIGYIIFRKGYVDKAINESDSMFSRLGDILANSIGCSYGCFKKLVWDTKEEIVKIITPDDIKTSEAELLRKTQQYPIGAHIIPANNNKNFQQQSQGGVFINQNNQNPKQQARVNPSNNQNNQNFQQQHVYANTFANPNYQNFQQQANLGNFVNPNNQNSNQNQYFNRQPQERQKTNQQTQTNVNLEAPSQGRIQRNTGRQNYEENINKWSHEFQNRENEGMQINPNEHININAASFDIQEDNNNIREPSIMDLNANPNLISQDLITNASRQIGGELLNQFFEKVNNSEFIQKINNNNNFRPRNNRENQDLNRETNTQNNIQEETNTQNNNSGDMEHKDIVIDLNKDGGLEAPTGKKTGKQKSKNK
jgi:hypothetical protein